jgi:phage shock protein PspC (stress-responsive transcriptional regulator)
MEFSMQLFQSQPFARKDTLLGVCEALGEDFRFHPNILRVALAVVLLVNPLMVIGGYAAAGVVVALVRWIFPNPVPAEAAAGSAEPARLEPAAARQEERQAELREEREPLALAA